MVYFWISGISLIVVGAIGLIGNTLNLIILLQSTFRKHVFYQLLGLMAVFDIIFTLAFAIEEGYTSLESTGNFREVLPFLSYNIAHIGLVGSIYTTVMVSNNIV